MLKFFKKYWLIIFLAALAMVLSILWFAKPETPPKEIERREELNLVRVARPTLQGVRLAESISIEISVRPKEEQAPLLALDLKPSFSNTQASKIAKALDFKTSPLVAQDITLGTTYGWTEENRSLTIIPATNQFFYGKDLVFSPFPQEGRLFSEGEAEFELQNLLSQMELALPSLQLQKNVRTVSLLGQELITTPPNEADFTEIEYTGFFNDFPFVEKQSSTTVARAVFDKSEELVEFEWKNPFLRVFPKENYPLKDFNEISNTIKQRGIIAHFAGADPFLPLDPTTISNIKLLSLDLGYSVDLKEGVAQPVFIFEGIAFVRGEGSKIILHLPAIKEEFFRN